VYYCIIEKPLTPQQYNTYVDNLYTGVTDNEYTVTSYNDYVQYTFL